jgi:hypothetical protein
VKLTLSEVHPGCVAVQCEADSEIYQSLKPGRPVPNPLPVKDVIWFDATKSTIIIRPIITYPSERYFEAKYDQIEEIVLDGFDVELPDGENAVHDARDDVIVELDAEHLGDLRDLLRQVDVGARGRRIARRMIVHQSSIR